MTSARSPRSHHCSVSHLAHSKRGQNLPYSLRDFNARLQCKPRWRSVHRTCIAAPHALLVIAWEPMFCWAISARCLSAISDSVRQALSMLGLLPFRLQTKEPNQKQRRKRSKKIPLIFNIKLGLPPKNNKNSCITNNRKSKGGKKTHRKSLL